MHNPRTQAVLLLLLMLGWALTSASYNNYANNNPKPTPTIVEHAPTGATVCMEQYPAEKLSNDVFLRMWNNTSADSPGELIRSLDTAYEAFKGRTGGQCIQLGWWIIPQGSVVWTDTHEMTIFTRKGKVATVNDFVPLRPQGGWGVFYAATDLYIRTPGRYTLLDQKLDPLVDLPGWNKPKGYITR